MDTLNKSRKETNHNLASFNSATLVENGIQGWPSQQKDYSHKRITDIGKNIIVLGCLCCYNKNTINCVAMSLHIVLAHQKIILACKLTKMGRILEKLNKRKCTIMWRSFLFFKYYLLKLLINVSKNSEIFLLICSLF